MNRNEPSAAYELRLRQILSARDWEGLREFSRAENQLPDDVYAQDSHFGKCWSIS